MPHKYALSRLRRSIEFERWLTAMVKTFHNTKNTHQSSSQQEDEILKHTVKTFSQVQKNEQKTKAELVLPRESRGATVIFKNQVHTIKSDLNLADSKIVSQIDAIIENQFPHFKINNSEYIVVDNISNKIDILDPLYQVDFGSDYSKRFQAIQAFMSDYVKDSQIMDLTRLCDVIIHIVKSIDIDIFNPDKISTKIARFLGSRRQKVASIRKEFDYACDQIDARLDKAHADFSRLRSQLEEFRRVIADTKQLERDVSLALIALIMRLESINRSEHDLPSGIWNQVNEKEKQRVKERWQRKLTNLQALSQSILLTLPQVTLYEQNWVNSFGCIEELKVNLVQVWKQQFLTVVAVDESSDVSMFYDLQQAQECLVDGIRELNSYGI